MAPTAASMQEKTTTVEEAVTCPELTTSPVKHIHHRAYACWDSEETRHFYEDILEMPLIATDVVEDPFCTDGSGYCYTFFEIGDGRYACFL
jgi:glyoxylase I family protein